MKAVLFAAFLATAALAMNIHHTVQKVVNDPTTIDKINSQATTWVAGKNDFFDGWDLSDTKKLMGWKKNTNRNYKLGLKSEIIDSLPTNFSSATQWSECSTIGTIYNQADCGGCWAFGCVEAVSDRYCIHKGKDFDQILSFMELVACADNGCEGGDAGDAWNYAAEDGLVTGDCLPYTIPSCPPQQQPCLNFTNTPDCPSNVCSNASASWNPRILSSAYGVSGDEQSIMTEIYQNGPVEACFDVYADFVTYKSGVYQQTSQDYLGGHCIKIIGWGVEKGLPYWLCNNSWTTYWGDKGQFKILRGQDECGIEDDVVAGMP
eukprot:TRINITY_DN760_c0_g1_i1.p1 TRINITY_DN760_c0_g1~~TRINITY_DN760_c0_g1_i1.p1  ORF type:complete len:319 (+),score=56.35 TRINITY_DN760_c0_g1_i1:53-1009(+)